MSDFLFAFTEWLRTTWIAEFALKMGDSTLTNWVVSHFWALPILQMIHIMAIAGSFAAVLMLNMRVFGLAGHATLAETARRYTKVLWWSLAVVIASGIGMLFGDTVRNLVNSIFWIKMSLVVFAIGTALVFTTGMKRRLATTAGDVVGGGTKATAAFLVILWCIIMLCGRWIAYAPT
jgi:hypothetical protein